jgi:hypothetical protein
MRMAKEVVLRFNGPSFQLLYRAVIIKKSSIKQLEFKSTRSVLNQEHGVNENWNLALPQFLNHQGMKKWERHRQALAEGWVWPITAGGIFAEGRLQS